MIKRCEVCDDVGWIDSFNTDIWEDEIQKCDECNIFETDYEAQLAQIMDKADWLYDQYKEDRAGLHD